MPAIIPAIGAGVSLFGAIKGSNNADKADDIQKQQLDQQGQIIKKQSGLSDTLAGYSNDLYNLSKPALSTGLNYYQSLANGNAAGINAVNAPQVAQLMDTYKGAANNISSGMTRGGARDYALANLSTQRAGQLGLMPMMARSNAMGQLSSLGLSGLSGAQGFAGAASSALSGAGATSLGSGNQAGTFGQQQWDRASSAGSNLANIFMPSLLNLTKRGGGGLGSSQTTPNFTSFMPGGDE